MNLWRVTGSVDATTLIVTGDTDLGLQMPNESLSRPVYCPGGVSDLASIRTVTEFGPRGVALATKPECFELGLPGTEISRGSRPTFRVNLKPSTVTVWVVPAMIARSMGGPGTVPGRNKLHDVSVKQAHNKRKNLRYRDIGASTSSQKLFCES